MSARTVVITVVLLAIFFRGAPIMAENDLHLFNLPGVPAADGQQWQPRLSLMVQRADAAPNGRAVLYIHGGTFPSESSIFFRFGGRSWADALNDAGFSVWGLDFAGYGRSENYPLMAQDMPPEAEPLGRAPDAAQQIERAVHSIMTETGVSRVSVIAHSWGTMPAGLFAGAHPELVDRLIFFGPIVRRDVLPAVPSLGPWRLITVAEQKQRFTEDVPPGAAPVLLEADFPAWAELYLKADPTSFSRTPPSVKTPTGPIADVMNAWSGEMPYDPAKISTPILIVRGEWDSLCQDTDADWLRQALRAAPEIRDIIIPKATHLMHLERGRHALYTASVEFLRAQ